MSSLRAVTSRSFRVCLCGFLLVVCILFAGYGSSHADAAGTIDPHVTTAGTQAASAQSVGMLPRFVLSELGTPRTVSPRTALAVVRTSASSVSTETGLSGVTTRFGTARDSLSPVGVLGGQSFRYRHGLIRRDQFGYETSVLSNQTVEELQTVVKRTGDHVWSWRLTAPGLRAEDETGGGIEFKARSGAPVSRLSAVAIYDRSGTEVTPTGAHWSLRRVNGGWMIELRLNDSRLPVPYTIDPAIVNIQTEIASSYADNAIANWTIGFIPSSKGALAAGDTITAAFTNLSSYTFPASPGVVLFSPWGSVSSTCQGTGSTNGATVTITLANAPGQTCAMPANAEAGFRILGIALGPVVAGKQFAIGVSTSQDKTVNELTWDQLENSLPTTDVTLAGSPQTAGATSTWTIGWTAQSYDNELVGGSTIEVSFPSAFGLPAHPTATLANSPGCSATAATQGQVVTVTLADAAAPGSCGSPFNSGYAQLLSGTLSLGGITNPPAGTYSASSFSVETSSEGPTATSPAEDVTIFPQDLAYKYMPVLNFDSTEKWRPLNVDMFLNETDPSSGAPWNQLCSPELGCTGLVGASSLQSYTTADSYISIHRDSGSDPDSYVSPTASCYTQLYFPTFPPTVTTLHDCDTGDASAIYYTIAGPSPGGYDYIEYWIFYRYNQAFEDQGNHAGDWEGITVVPSPDGNALEWVELSHHGAWNSYLPSSLDCGTSEGACSVPGAEDPNELNVDSFPAAGSHANYPQAGDSDIDDNNNDGMAAWGNNLKQAELLPLPSPAGSGIGWTDAGPENWTDWPGAWGDTAQTEQYDGTWSGSPCSPAAPLSAANGHCGADHGGHYYAPWSQTGTNLNCSGGTCPQVRSANGPVTPLTCSSWFGSGVAIAACDKATMDGAMGSHGMLRKGGFTLGLKGKRAKAGSAPGIAQLLGMPLQPGAEAVVSGSVPRGTEISVRARRGRYFETATFAGFGQIHGTAKIEIRRGARGRPQPILRIGRSTVVPKVTTRTTITRRELVALRKRELKARHS